MQHDGQAREPALVVLGVSGELDVACAQQLRSELESVIDRAPGEVVIDLSALAFCDSSGLSALLNARLHALASGRVLCLAGASPQMLRLLELTGARGLFPVVPVPPT
ncbi:STAS domain-containing protein [Streptomyces sp. cmx-4-9]|uniref:STAS domain-containing protein n=1 Tax=Streptomyces sp. cmx-4-9 TaxID=2790941 RepID=UPI003980C9F7